MSQHPPNAMTQEQDRDWQRARNQAMRDAMSSAGTPPTLMNVVGTSPAQQSVLGAALGAVHPAYTGVGGLWPAQTQPRVRVGFSNSREADVLIDTTDNAIRLAVPLGLSELATLQALHEQIAKQMAIATMEKDEADSRFSHLLDTLNAAKIAAQSVTAPPVFGKLIS